MFSEQLSLVVLLTFDFNSDCSVQLEQRSLVPGNRSNEPAVLMEKKNCRIAQGH